MSGDTIAPDASQDVRRVTQMGLGVNIVLSLLKISAGWLGHSQAVLADGVHSLSDVTSDVAVLVGVRFWNAPADDSHPHGHARIEALVTLFIGLMLGSVAVGLCYHAIVSVREATSATPGRLAVIAAIISIIVKEWLYRYTIRTGRRHRSRAVIANAWHHRSDAISSIPATVAVLAASIAPGWQWLDQVGAIVVSVFILQATWKIIWPALLELTDASASAEAVQEIKRIALQTSGVKEVHQIRTRQMGSGVQVDLHVLVEDELTVLEGHSIAREVRQRLREHGPDLTDVVVHIEPYEDHSAG